jgi:hypothetical protein
MDIRLQASLRTWKTNLRFILLEIVINPFLAIGEKLPFVIFIFSLGWE